MPALSVDRVHLLQSLRDARAGELLLTLSGAVLLLLWLPLQVFLCPHLQLVAGKPELEA